MQGDNLRCSHGKCVKKADRKPRKPRKPRAPKVPKKGDACGDLDWPCCAHDGPEGARPRPARLLPAYLVPCSDCMLTVNAHACAVMH